MCVMLVQFYIILEGFHNGSCWSTNVGEMRSHELTLYRLPALLPKVQEVLFLFGVFSGDATSFCKKFNWVEKVCACMCMRE